MFFDVCERCVSIILWFLLSTSVELCSYDDSLNDSRAVVKFFVQCWLHWCSSSVYALLWFNQCVLLPWYAPLSTSYDSSLCSFPFSYLVLSISIPCVFFLLTFNPSFLSVFFLLFFWFPVYLLQTPRTWLVSCIY